MPYVVDTNIISEITKPRYSENVIDWFWDFNKEVYLTTVTIMELNYGIMRMPDGKRKTGLKETIDAIVKECANRIYVLDSFSAYLCAQLRHKAYLAGRTPQISDMMIAAICQRNDAILATHNVKDFDYLGVKLVDPFTYEPPTLERLRQLEQRRLGER